MDHLTLVLIASLLAFEVESKDIRIVNGDNTTIEEYPYQLSLEYNGHHHCGASLIKPNVALTAAHCTNEVDKKLLRVRAGSTLREKGGELADILSVCQHPDFSTTTVDYDLAVLILSRSLPLSDAIKTISYGPIDFDIAEGTMATITGWGLLSWNGSFPDILQVASVPKYDDAVCEDIYTNLTDRMFCFGHEDGRQDSCRSDSGGPLVVKDVQVGIVSFGNGCGEKHSPGVYVKISNENVTKFINECAAV